MSERENNHAMFVASLYTAVAIVGLVTAATAFRGMSPLATQGLALALALGGTAALAAKVTGARPTMGNCSARTFGWAAVSGVALSLMGSGALALEAALIPAWSEHFAAKQAMFSTLLGDPTWSAVPAIVLVVAITPGIFEELLFRGVLRSYLVPHSTTTARVLFVGVLFSLYHVDVTVLVPMFYVGAMLTLIAERAGGWLAAVVAHVALNTFSAVVWVRVAGDWMPDVWSSAGLVVVGSALAMFAVGRVSGASSVAPNPA